MIVPMDKLAVFIYHQIRDEFLISMRKCGVVHVEITEKDDDGSIAEKMRYCMRIRSVLDRMDKDASEQLKHDSPAALINTFESLLKDRDVLLSRKTVLKEQLKRQLPWGNCDPEIIRNIEDATGYTARLIRIPSKKFSAKLFTDYNWQLIEVKSGKHYVLIFDRDKTVSLGNLHAEEIPLPEKSTKGLLQIEKSIVEKLAEIEKSLLEFSRYRSTISEFYSQHKSILDFDRVINSVPGAAEGTVYILRGWVPRDRRQELERELVKHEVGYSITKPDVNDKVPVFLRSKPMIKLFEPITRLFDLPGYKELDLTPFLAPFFVLFFGLCLGDAGYGLVIFFAALIARFFVATAKKGLCSLVALLGASTFIVGVVTGNLFGINTSGIKLLQKAVFFDQDSLFSIALILGFVQVLFGMFIRVINQTRQFGFASSLTSIGWILIVVGGVAAVGGGVPAFWSLVAAGVFLILFLNDLKSNIFLRFGKGLWELYGITGVFGDVLSYVRLFALGLSSTILGFVINEIGMEFRAIPWIGFPMALIFMLVGHTGNLLISSLGSFVHPLRLTFVEFYKNAGFTGGGKEYKPFMEKGTE